MTDIGRITRQTSAATDAFIGRQEEVARLRELVRGVAGGSGGAVLVEGEPWVGKSTLLSAGLADARRLGCQVFRATADELNQRLPLRVMLDCLEVDWRSTDPQRRQIMALLQGDSPGGGMLGIGDPVAAAVERLLSLVDQLCADSPVVVVVDDLHWADQASLLVWHRLVRVMRQLPLLLVGAYRRVPKRDAVEQLRRGLPSNGGTLISLEPLAKGEIAELVSRLAGAPAGPQLRRLAADHAAGNPLDLREIVDSLLRERAIRIEGGVAELDASRYRPPVSLASAIAERLNFLSPESIELLRVAAMHGHQKQPCGRRCLALPAPRQRAAPDNGTSTGWGGRRQSREGWPCLIV